MVMGLLLVSSSFVCCQPFAASVGVFPACGSQYSYGQKICGQLSVSDDAWVTRWVEDQYGAIWYHWGTRYYTAGTHSFCGYAGFPMGPHIMKLHAVRVSDSAVADDVCAYTVCCGYSAWIPDQPGCKCEDVTFSAEIDKETVSPGDDITVRVTVTNTMGADCSKKFDAGHLEIDWGILGGDTSPLERDLSVKSGETRVILEETHIIPPVSEGDYNVVISYSDAECTWIDYTTVSVEIPTEGSFEILSYPDSINVGEKGRIKVLIRNKSQKEAQYTLLIGAPPGLDCTQTSISSIIPRAGYREITIPFQPEEAGTFTVTLELMSEGTLIGQAPVTISVEKPLSGTLRMMTPPHPPVVDESMSMELEVVNTSMYDSAYQMKAVPSGNVQVTPIPELYIPALQSRNVEIFMTTDAQGVHDIILYLETEGQVLDMVEVSFKTEEKRSPLGVIFGGVGIAILAAMVLYFVFRHRSSVPPE